MKKEVIELERVLCERIIHEKEGGAAGNEGVKGGGSMMANLNGCWDYLWGSLFEQENCFIGQITGNSGGGRNLLA